MIASLVNEAVGWLLGSSLESRCIPSLDVDIQLSRKHKKIGFGRVCERVIGIR